MPGQMHELTIRHLPASGRRGARVRVSHRPGPGAQPQEAESPFRFQITPERRALIQWYLEQYLRYPGDQFQARTLRLLEASVERVQAKLAARS